MMLFLSDTAFRREGIRALRPLAALAALAVAACAPGPTARNGGPRAANGLEPVPPSLPDPLEPVNRGIGVVNSALLLGVLHPASRGYRAVVPPPVRESLSHFSRNATYPGRVANLMLQQRWQGAADESLRFLTNTTVGVGGLFDVATAWNQPRANADFAQTFKGWGWEPDSYLMLPFFGPSDPPSAAGLAADKALEPWAYLDSPYSYGSGVLTFNRLSGQTAAAVRLIRSEGDPYATAKLLWSQKATADEPDWQPIGPPDLSCLETLASVTNKTQDPEFAERGRRRRVTIPATGRELPFLVWLQPGRAPLVHLVPGVGSSPYANTALAVAERLHQDGCSVAIVPSVFHPQFITGALTAAVPGYPSSDCRDLHAALTAIDQSLEQRHPGRFGARVLCGLSLGGFHALHLAATERRHDPAMIRFDSYVAINCPVNLLASLDRIDAYHAVPATWPAATRQPRIANIFAKAVAILQEGAPPEGVAPFSGDESKYMIGLAFRLLLRDAIYSSQTRQNLGVLTTPLNPWRREAAYHEIEKFSFHDYIERFVRPYFAGYGLREQDFTREADLRNFGRVLARQSKARVITNANDFVLSAAELAWLRQTFGPRLAVLPRGGHMGNFNSPEFAAALRRMMVESKTD
jgi:ABC-type transporter lipoprotein component MlaA